MNFWDHLYGGMSLSLVALGGFVAGAFIMLLHYDKESSKASEAYQRALKKERGHARSIAISEMGVKVKQFLDDQAQRQQ